MSVACGYANVPRRRDATKVPADDALCVCGGICPRCTGDASTVAPSEFARVRLHPDAPERTRPLEARAVTVGRDIYFHPGEYRPGTPAGEALIRHELAHTLQTRGQPDEAVVRSVSAPGDALEQNADALARGETAHVVAAAAGMALRSPFDAETADEKRRRRQLLASIDANIKVLIRLLQTRGLMRWSETHAERGGVKGVVLGKGDDPASPFNSYPEREQRIRRLIGSLIEMGAFYRTSTIPAGFAAPTANPTNGGFESKGPARGSTGGGLSVSAGTPEQVDLMIAYDRFLVDRGLPLDTGMLDFLYIGGGKQMIPGAATGARPLSSGIPSGAYVIVPDVENNPRHYRIVDGSTPAPRGVFVRELWHDDFGYYYWHGETRIDVAAPW